MRIFLTDEEVLDLVPDVFDHFPDSDFTHKYAERMDMVYNKELDLYEDINEVSIDKLKRDAIKYSKV